MAKRRTKLALARKERKSSKHVAGTSKYAEKKKARIEMTEAEYSDMIAASVKD